MFRNIITDPTISYVDGKITEESVLNIVDSVQAAVSTFDKEIGTDNKSFVSSIVGMLANRGSALIPHVKYGVIINGCSDLLTISGKKYTLSLVPDAPESLVFSSGSYTYTPTQVFTNNNQYTVSGRTIIFSSVPSVASLTVVYDGYIPEDYGAEINDQTLFPIPENILSGRVSKPTVTEVDLAQNIYSISVESETFLPGIDLEFSTPISSSIPTFLSSYVSSTGAIETPLDYASLWKLVSGEYVKVELTYLKIISANTFIVKTLSPIDITGTYVVSLFSKGIPDMIAELYVAYKNHNHDSLGNSKRIDHENLINDETKDYHPQYVAKSGYSNTNKANRMMGNLFFSSLDETNDGSNTLSASNKLVFGDYANGHTVNRETGEDGFLRVDPRGANGLNILIDSPAEGQDSKTAIKFGATLFSNRQEVSKPSLSTVLDAGERLLINATSGLDIDSIETRTISIKDGSTINVAGVKIVGQASGAKIISDAGKELSIEGDVKFKSGIFEGASVNELIIPNTKKIIFNDSQDFLQSTSKGPLFKNKISISSYSSVNVTSEDDQQPLSLSNITSVRSNNPVYFIKPIENGTISNGVTYSFRETIVGHTRIDRVQDWVKQDITVGNIVSSGITIPDSSFLEKKGLDIGTTGKIYSSADDISCAIDSLIFESKDDIIFLKFGDTSTGCNNKQFAGLMVGKITVNGSITATSDIITEADFGAINIVADGDISAAGNLTIEKIAAINSLKVSGTASISGKASLQDADVAGTLSINTLDVSGNGVIAGDLNLGKSLSVTGAMSVTKNVTLSADLSVEGKIVSSKITSQTGVFEELAVSGDTNISGKISGSKIDISGNAIIGGELTSSAGSFKNSVSSQKIEASDATFSKLSVDGKSFLKDIDISGSVSISEALTVGGKITGSRGISIEGGARIYGGVTLSEGLKVSDGIDAAGGLKVSGDTALSGSLAAGETTVTGNIIASGSLSIKDGLAVIKNLEVTSQANFSKISVGTIYLENQISGTLESSARIGSIETGSLTLGPREGHDDKLTSYVNAEFLKDVYAAGLFEGNIVRAKSVFTLGDKDAEDAVYLTSDGLHFAKKTSIIGVHEITMDKLIGRTNIQYTELSQFNSSISNGIINAIEASKFVISDNLSVEGILNVPRSLVVGGTIFFNKMVPMDDSSGFVDIVAGAAVYE